MEKFLGQDLKPSERVALLSDNCDAIEEIGFTRRFSVDELNQKKEDLANVSIEISDIEEEKRELMADIKFRLKPLTEEKKIILEEVKKKSEFVQKECYKFIDHEAKTVGYYDETGELVSTRTIMPQEMQKTIFQLNTKTGTED